LITMISFVAAMLCGCVVMISDKFFGIPPERPFNPCSGIPVETYRMFPE
jgi:hypothetical protein